MPRSNNELQRTAGSRRGGWASGFPVAVGLLTAAANRGRQPAKVGLDRKPGREYIVPTTTEDGMKARLVRIGNSRGIRLPKPLIEEAGLKEDVQLRVRDGAVIITSLIRPRSGWAEAARQIREQDQDKLLDEPTPTEFDQKGWRWR